MSASTPRRSTRRAGTSPGSWRRIGVPGIRIGHAGDASAGTGVTVILAEDGAVAGMQVSGFASGSRQTDSLDPCHLVPVIHGLVLAGGSGFGLDAAAGAVSHLENRQRGFPVGRRVVPIVPSAILFDLNVGDARAAPTADMTRAACESSRADRYQVGCVGAGTGASCGKLLGIECATKTGVGGAFGSLPDGTPMMALAAANPYGDIVDPDGGCILAGTRASPRSRRFVGSDRWIRDPARVRRAAFQNTTLVVVATEARLDKVEATRLARMAGAGFARALRPAPTLYDGDVIFTLSTGDRSADPNALGALAAELVATAIADAALSARGQLGLPAHRDLMRTER